MIPASCLCGAVAWTVARPVPPLFHCHCGRCRKAHGAAFATYVAVSPAAVTLTGQDAVASWNAPGGERRFCRHCGSVVPYAAGAVMYAPAGNFEEDPGARPAFHMFAASRAPWYHIGDALPQYPDYPPGLSGVPVADIAPRDPPGRPRGSCLCGAVRYILEDPPIRRRYCHCGRCRKNRSAAHAANLTTRLDGLRFTAGADELGEYKVPDARYFATVFCRTCGSAAPRRDSERGIAILPMGGLDDDPGVRPTAHIFVGSRAPWFEITGDLPQYPEYPPE
jgi:hypothetical protein